MSKLGALGHFFVNIGKFAPLILAITPLAPIAPAVAAAIQEAEAIQGATGPEKRAHVINVATAAATVAQQSGAKVDPAAVQAAAGQTIDAIVAVAKAAHPQP